MALVSARYFSLRPRGECLAAWVVLPAASGSFDSISLALRAKEIPLRSTEFDYLGCVVSVMVVTAGFGKAWGCVLILFEIGFRDRRISN